MQKTSFVTIGQFYQAPLESVSYMGVILVLNSGLECFQGIKYQMAELYYVTAIYLTLKDKTSEH